MQLTPVKSVIFRASRPPLARLGSETKRFAVNVVTYMERDKF
jgi:hypothetical protein